MFAEIQLILEEYYEALEEHICITGFEKQLRELLNYYEDTFIGRDHRKAFRHLVGLYKLNIFKLLPSLKEELSPVPVHVIIDIVNIQKTQQNTRPLMERRDTIPIITLLEQA
ncbi:hypothetical protein HZS_2251 [Henneguya salminicola]|nr:hypothetical protein HZS_2251 [Henneguya salminicola]